MTHYNPAIPPDPAVWLELDEQLRIALVEDYHKAANLKLPNVTLHAAFHVVVENQLAEGLKPTITAVARLIRQGVSRHNAIHAVGSLLVEHVHRTATDDTYDHFDEGAFEERLARLKAREWK